MMSKLAMVLATAAGATATSQPSMGVAVQAQSNPLKKVITLIEEMKKQVEQEAEADMSSYEKYTCWCTKTKKEKDAAVATADQRLADLSAFMENAVAKEAQLKTEIETLTADIAADEEALSSATTMRGEENKDFTASEADQKETLAAIKSAVDVLSKVQLVQKSGGAVDMKAVSAALLQVKNVVSRQNPGMFKSVMQRDLFDMLGSMEEPKQGAAFLANANPNYWEPSEEEAGAAKKGNDLQGAAAGAKSYNSRSGQIFGILRTMNDQFVRDLSNSQKEEFQALVMYQKLRASKLAEIASGKEQKQQKETELADLMAAMATAEEDIASLTAAREADLALLANLKETCTTEKNGYEARVKVRSEEIRALAETLKILTDDDARSLFGKTMSFVQVSSSRSVSASDSASTVAMQDRMAQKAFARIAAVAKKHKNWSLLSLAVRVQLDAFTKVKEMMDKMLNDLKQQQKDEYDKHEQCKFDIDKVEDDIKVGQQEKKDLGEKHLSITNHLATLADEIASLQADGAANEVALKQAGEARKAENLVFQTTIADQRATINILNKALARLEEFYGFAQVNAHGRQEPGAAIAAAPEKGKAYEKSHAAGGVLGMIKMVIKDAQATEAEAAADEQSAQESYATLVKDTKASIEADRNTVSMKQEEVAKAETSKAETEESQSANEASLGELTNMEKGYHQDCDWLLKYFDTRQTARQEEMDAIGEAKAILAGSKFA